MVAPCNKGGLPTATLPTCLAAFPQCPEFKNFLKGGLDSFYDLVFGLGVLAGGQRHQNRPCSLQRRIDDMKCMS